MGTTGQSITLANSIIGVGILAMPFCFQQCGVILASLILVFMGLVSRLCCHYLLKSALIARRRNFEFLAFHVFGSAGKMAVEVGIIGFLMGTCIAYFVVVGDLGPQIISKMFNINQSDILRTSIMVIVSLVCILPLGLLRNVDSLSNVSAATIGFYVCLVLKVITEAASQLLAGDWHTKVSMWKPSGLLQCVPIFSMALFCQTQLFEVFDSMSYLSLEKMNVVTKNAINICTVVYFTLGLFGYIAFCSQTISGNILMSLSQTMASDVIKLGFVMSVAFSFPLIIFPCRASLYSLLYRKVHPAHHDHIINHSIPETTFRCITVSIIVVSLFISLLIPNIELVLGFVGSTIGVIICILFPAACFISVTFKDTNERLLAKAVIVLGLVILVLGTYANLQAAEHQPDKYDEKYITQERIDKIVEDFFEAKKLKNADEVIRKPVLKVEPSKDMDIIKASKEVKLDSEFQPPNPVPPETLSDEKPKEVDTKIEKNIRNEKDVPNKKAEVNKDKLESHPRDVITKLNNEGLLVKEEAKKKEEETKKGEEEAKMKEEEAKKKAEEEKAKLDKKLQDDLDMKKQQQLIETIKQHHQEQKELMKEQKEILDEIKIIKDAEKPPPVKSDLDPVDTKKIAVESIQKIADAAIHRLSLGVSDKPVNKEVNNENNEPLNNIANNAVKEIAEKAVETIVAIQETVKEEENIQKANLAAAPVVNKAPVQNNIVQQHQQGNPQSIGLNQQVSNDQQANMNNINQQAVPNNPNVVQNIPNPEQNNIKAEIPLANKPAENVMENARRVIENIQKKHLHSADEPQSYKLGEDQQKLKSDDLKIPNGNVQNVPLAVALNANTQLQGNEAQSLNDKPVETNPVVKNKIKEEAENHLRAKREVVDCSKRESLKPEDMKICKASVEEPVEYTYTEPKDLPLLPININLNDAIRSPIEPNVILRSLKSFAEKGR